MALAAAPALTIGGPPRVNLLPRAVTASRQRASLLRTWLLGLLAALGVVLVATGGAYALQLTAQQSLDQANADTVRLLGEVAALQPVNEKLKLESELGDYRTQAMGTDLTWATLVSSVESALPADTVLAGFTLVPGGNPVGDDPQRERARLAEGVAMLRSRLDALLADLSLGGGDHADVMETFRMFAHDQGWLRRMREVVMTGLTAEAAVDPMPPNISDGYVMLKPVDKWPEPRKTRDEILAAVHRRN